MRARLTQLESLPSCPAVKETPVDTLAMDVMAMIAAFDEQEGKEQQGR